MRKTGLLITIIFLLSFEKTFSQIDWHKAGKQSFSYNELEGLKNKPLKVWFYSPTDRPDTLPVVIMLHGAERNSSNYLDQWMPAADLYKLVIIAPEFSKEDYKGSEKYNLGNVYNEKQQQMNPTDEWTFSIIEPLFDFVKSKTNNQSAGYYLSGHSAGSQFVHRFLYFVPNNRVIKAVAANAGWYTMPDIKTAFPYGLKNTNVTADDLKKDYAKEVFIVLGENDTDTSSSLFQKEPVFNLQGLNRFERGLNYFAVSKQKAEELNTAFNWQLITVPGVAHSNKEIAKIAAALFTMKIRK